MLGVHMPGAQPSGTRRAASAPENHLVMSAKGPFRTRFCEYVRKIA
jgi:hypothetical protein